MVQTTDISSKIAAEVPYLRRFARALLGDAASADDLVQDTIERALSRLHLFDETRNLRTWLYTILRNIFLNNIRQKDRRGLHMNIEEVSESNLLQSPGQSSHMAVRDITAAIQQLPSEQKEVLILVAIEEMTYEETANIIGTPIGTVMSRLSRARNRLKTIMYGETKLLERQAND